MACLVRVLSIIGKPQEAAGWSASASFSVEDGLPQPSNMEYQKRSKNGNAEEYFVAYKRDETSGMALSTLRG
jgi:hypothetical protein